MIVNLSNVEGPLVGAGSRELGYDAILCSPLPAPRSQNRDLRHSILDFRPCEHDVTKKKFLIGVKNERRIYPERINTWHIKVSN